MEIIKRHRDTGGPLTELQDEMHDLFERFFGESPSWLTDRNRWWPTMDVAEQNDKFVVKVELPGMKPDDIEVSVHNSILTISGEKKQSEEHSEENRYHTECRYGSFRRTIRLPSTVDSDKVEASCHDGILTINLAKTEQTKAKQIKIKQ